MNQIIVSFILILFSSLSFAQLKTNKIQFGEEVVLADCSFRGAAVAHNMAIVSGSNGKVFNALLSEKPLQWNLRTVAGCDTLQFRDVAILNAQVILLMSAGAGKSSQIWKSKDAGATWKKEYQNLKAKAFFNGFDFWDDQQGVLISDPIDKQVYLLQTKDGGSNWSRLKGENLPTLLGKEYGFAASGTGIQCFGNENIRIGTGGQVARIFGSNNYGKSWQIETTPILQGSDSQGIFSIDYFNEKQAIAVGGDYANDTLIGSNVITLNKSWVVTDTSKNIKFKSCVKYLNENVILLTGTSGTAISYNAGESWAYLKNTKGYHTIAFDKLTNQGILAGSEGRVLAFWLAQ